MADESLREEERNFASSRSTEDEAAWLARLVRAGRLSLDRVEVAARCGHPAARAISEVGIQPDNLEEWVRGLPRCAGAGFRVIAERLFESGDEERGRWVLDAAFLGDPFLAVTSRRDPTVSKLTRELLERELASWALANDGPVEA